MKLCPLAPFLLFLCGAAHADRDIVYSARYYAPPGSHRTSHFHIYRISPDGTGRTQLTFGKADEEMPQWSSSGRQITYLENTQTSKPLLLCEINADGSGRRVLKIVTDGTDRPPPAVPGYRLENAEADDGTDARHVLINLKTGRRLALTVPSHEGGNERDDALLPLPGHGLIYVLNNHNSTLGIDSLFYQLSPETGELRYLTEGQFLTWSSDGTRFCTAPGRGLAQYGAWPDKRERDVWSAPLFIRATAGGPMTPLTPRLSYVTGADWRKGN